MTGPRKAIAGLSLAGLFIALYLWMYKLGLTGPIVCGTGGCETVQLSPYARFLGVEVALIGVLGYVAFLVLALLGLQPRHAGRSWPARLLLVLSGGALLFTLYLKYLEFFVIHAVCRWCVASAVIVALIFTLSVVDRRQAALPPAP